MPPCHDSIWVGAWQCFVWGPRLLILISTSNSSVFILRAERRQRTRNEEKYWNDQYYFNGRVESLQSTYRARIVVTNNSKTDVLTTLLWRRAASRHCSLHKAARPDSCWVFTRYLHSVANKRWMLNNHLQPSPAPWWYWWWEVSHLQPQDTTLPSPAQQTPSSAR